MNTYEYNGKLYNLSKFAYFEKGDDSIGELAKEHGLTEKPYSIKCHTSFNRKNDQIIYFEYRRASVRDFIYSEVIKKRE